jgi:ubiquitin C-terminal hydrolase
VKGYNEESYVYDLYAICNHTGGFGGGHYFAHIKNANGKWYSFNDSNIKELTNLNEIVTNKAYCLFYRKKNKLIYIYGQYYNEFSNRYPLFVI